MFYTIVRLCVLYRGTILGIIKKTCDNGNDGFIETESVLIGKRGTEWRNQFYIL